MQLCGRIFKKMPPTPFCTHPAPKSCTRVSPFSKVDFWILNVNTNLRIFHFFTALCISRIWSRMSTGRWQSRSLLHWQCWTFDPEWILGQWSLCTHQYSRFCWIGSASVPSRVFKSLGNCDCNHRWHWIHWCCRGTLFGRSPRRIGQSFLHAYDFGLLGTCSKFNLKSDKFGN